MGGSKPTQSPAQEPAPTDLDFGGGGVAPEAGPAQANAAPNPLEKQPFNAGVEADENSDPKKYIEQLTGKLGQSLRTYNQQQGQPDFQLEKFAINSLLSATHTSEMDEADQNDIINKIQSAGEEKPEQPQEPAADGQEPTQAPAEAPAEGGENMFEGSEVFEHESLFLANPKKNNMFQPNSNDVLNEMEPCWSGYKQVGMKEKGGKEVPNCVKEELTIQNKSSIFTSIIKNKLTETFNPEDMIDEFIEPDVKPEVKPKVKPKEAPIKPSRRDAPFLPNVEPDVKPDPKAMKESKVDYELYHKTLASTLTEIEKFAMGRGYDAIEFGQNDVDHIAYGITKRMQLDLNKGGKPQRVKLNAQIYRMDSGTYELNIYIS